VRCCTSNFLRAVHPSKIPSMKINSRKFTPAEHLLLQLRGADWSRLLPKARKNALERAFRFWRKQGFPYYRLSSHQIRQDLSTLLAKDPRSVFNGRDLRTSNAGLRLANSFQPSMWGSRVNRYHSPMQVFRDDKLFRKAIERSFRIWPDRFGASPSCMRRILKTYPGAASVSNYRPMIAKAIISKYCPLDGTVVDFAAGFGGRLLGAIASHRNYVGIEPNHSQVKGFLRMSKALRSQGFGLPRLTFLHGTAESKLFRMKSASVELVFSSPPFFNWEHYSRSRRQSFRQYPTYQMWLEGFLHPAISQSFRILKSGGHLALNVTNGNRLPSAEDVSRIARAAGFKALRAVHEMVFPKVPYLHPRHDGPVKRELILVFRKP
jgi:tRNA1(Val) A37 N6-methylase TrmN6